MRVQIYKVLIYYFFTFINLDKKKLYTRLGNNNDNTKISLSI